MVVPNINLMLFLSLLAFIVLFDAFCCFILRYLHQIFLGCYRYYYCVIFYVFLGVTGIICVLFYGFTGVTGIICDFFSRLFSRRSWHYVRAILCFLIALVSTNISFVLFYVIFFLITLVVCCFKLFLLIPLDLCCSC